MNAHANLPVQRANIAKLCRFRDLALEKRKEANAALEAAFAIIRETEGLAKQATMGYRSHTTRGSDHCAYNALFQPNGWDVDKGMDIYRKQLDASIWRYVIDTSGINSLMDREAKDQFASKLIDDVPEATEENVRATIETLLQDSELIFQRGLANAFTKLDRRFKSHDGFKIGSRIIFERAFDEHGYTTWGGTWDSITDVERVFWVLDGRQGESYGGLRDLVSRSRKGINPQQSVTEAQFFTIKGFKNGNAHLWMHRDDLVEKVNKVLAEYYGEVLPDAYAEGDGSDLFRRSTVPAKDLQFYPSPEHVVEQIIDRLQFRISDTPARILEPSAGQGAIAFAAAAKGAIVDAVEINPQHCDVIRGEIMRRGLADNVSLREGNFLKMTSAPVYDYVLMNPPFYGTHYMDHVRHAFEFLRPGGLLRAVLPASAEVNESKRHDAFRKWIDPIKNYNWRGAFAELPAESFKDSGTRIQTVILHVKRKH